MAEEAAQGKLHEVSDEEADAVIKYCENAIPHNEMIGRALRNVYGRLKKLEAENKDLKAKRSKKAEAPAVGS